MELSEEQIRPRLVDPRESDPAAVGGRRASGTLARLQQQFAVALGALDIVHDAVAAGKRVLQFDLDQRQLLALVGDRVEEVVGVAEAQFMARRSRGWPAIYSMLPLVGPPPWLPTP